MEGMARKDQPSKVRNRASLLKVKDPTVGICLIFLCKIVKKKKHTKKNPQKNSCGFKLQEMCQDKQGPVYM